MIREALENFQITPNLTENIMREIARLKPVAPSGSKPVVPWAIGLSAVTIVLLMLGFSNQHLSRFQKPYNFNAASEMKVELIDAPVVLNLESEPDVRTQLGSSVTTHKNENAGQQPDEVLFAAAQTEGEDVSVSKQQWVQAEPARGTGLTTVFSTPEDELSVVDGDMNIHKLSADGKKWQYISEMRSLDTYWAARSIGAKWNDTFYVVPSDQLFASTDGGVTWDLLYSWQEEKQYWKPVELVLTDQAFYLAFKNGIFRSEDGGKTWEAINDGLAAKIVSLVTIRNTVHLGLSPVFAGTEDGLYRLEAGGWQRLELPVPAKFIRSVAATEKRLYVSVGLSLEQIDLQKADREQQRTWWMFRSTDFGDSWEDITPTNAWPIKGRSPWIQLVAVGETLLASEMYGGMVRSTDGGGTWLAPQPPGTSFPASPIYAAATVAGNAIYVAVNTGLYRTTNGGELWDFVNIGRHAQVVHLVAFKETGNGQDMPTTLYGRFEDGIMKTTDSGDSWKAVHAEIPMKVPVRNPHPPIVHVTTSDGVLYAKGGTLGSIHLYRVSADGNTLVPVQEIPLQLFDSSMLRLKFKVPPEHREHFSVHLPKSFPGATQFFKQLEQLEQADPQIDRLVDGGLRGAFAVSDNTFYMEYNFKLFRWEPGDTEWYDTELEETAEIDVGVWHNIMEGFKLTVSGNIVYVGKRDGHLVVSFDRGNNWIDLTPALPFPVKVFKEIVFAGSTVYVATDAGVATSSDGKRWQAITDAAGTHLIMERLAVDGTNVYGASETHVYRLQSDGVTWKQLTPEVPDRVTSLAVDRNVLYVGTQSSGILHFTINEE